MVSLINFKRTLYVPKEIAEELQVAYESLVNERLYYQDGEFGILGGSDRYYDEIEKRKDEEDEGKEKYYIIKTGEKMYQYASQYDRPDPESTKNLVKIKSENHLVTLETFAVVAGKYGYTFFIKKTVPHNNGDISALVDSVQGKLQRMTMALDNLNDSTFNTKCDVHLGGGLLMTVNDLLLMEDCCTDELQGALDGGWRILGVTVQPDQRRPDYILGRFNPNKEGESSARRRP